MTVLPYLDAIPYLTGITAEERAYISRHSDLRVYKANEVIFVEGEQAQGLWVVERGRVKIYKLSPQGHELILHLRGPGKTFNDVGALDGGSNPASAAALSADVHVWLIPCEVITHLLVQNPVVALNVVRLLARRVRTLVGQIEDIALYSVLVRLARFLIRQMDDDRRRGPGVTRTAIAAHLNTTPQTISVALRELEVAGAVQFDRYRIIITDETRLRAIALL